MTEETPNNLLGPSAIDLIRVCRELKPVKPSDNPMHYEWLDGGTDFLKFMIELLDALPHPWRWTPPENKDYFQREFRADVDGNPLDTHAAESLLVHPFYDQEAEHPDSYWFGISACNYSDADGFAKLEMTFLQVAPFLMHALINRAYVAQISYCELRAKHQQLLDALRACGLSDTTEPQQLGCA